ncbi:sortase domain-containing protein [Frondihabitans australicus]|uniref:sortase domain-containing protein n=1 Tax=Frondihabitans australicus TaxID=386892 RepID=UPI0014765EE9|nr:sortase [Frondihabitans australicus]
MQRSRLRSALVVVALGAAAVLGLAGCAGAGASSAGPTPTPSPTATHDTDAAGRIQDPSSTSLSQAPAAGVVPTRVSIPAIGVNAGLQDLAIAADGSLNPPVGVVDAGWYAKGVVPGAVGPAVIAGHIDSTTQPGVFLHLAKLVPGDTVTVTMSSGSVETWKVSGSRAALKTAFPTSDVYGTSPTPQLRLITCGGTFNAAIGHYNENTIVFADLVSSTAPTK